MFGRFFIRFGRLFGRFLEDFLEEFAVQPASSNSLSKRPSSTHSLSKKAGLKTKGLAVIAAGFSNPSDHLGE